MSETHARVGRVLIVDDDEKLRFILRAHLKAAGYEVAEAADGRAGLAAAVEFRPDVIVMDITMPILDGITATRQIKADPRTAGCQVIMLTANSRTEDVIIGLDAGATEYVAKPFEVAELLARVRTALQLGRAHQQLDDLNSQLASEVHRKTRRLQILYHFNRSLSVAESVDEVLDLIVESARQATESRRISILMKADDGDSELRCVRAVGISPEVVERIRLRPDDGIAGRVFSSGATLVAERYGPSRTQDDRYSSDAFLSTPLTSDSRSTGLQTLGVLNVTNKEDGVPFSDEEIECIRSIADAGAVALNSQIHRRRLKDSVRVLLLTLGRLAEYRDEETALHLERVREYARILARALVATPEYGEQVTPAFVDDIYQAAPLHDIGKVGIPDEILNKTGPLTTEEFNIMKNHTEIGRRVLQLAVAETGPVPLLQMCVDIAYGHHERYDGRGYPQGVSGDDIPLAARIIAAVDAYDAMTSRRCYKDPVPHEEAVERIRAAAGEHFDPVVADALIRNEAEFAETRRGLTDVDVPELHLAI